jgi:Uma2 family endonuclease
MVATTTEIQKEVREIVALLMKRPITEEIAMRVEEIEGFEHLEIEDGNWVGFDEDEYMAGEEHGRIEFKLILRLGNHVEQNNLGVLYPGDTVFVLAGTPDDMRLKRRPDIAFVHREKIKHTKGYIFASPDLAVEIISPTERPGEIRKKLHEYLDHGVKQVWQVFSDSQEIVVHFPDGTSKTYRPGDTLSGGDLLPGFTLDIAAVFDAQ